MLVAFWYAVLLVLMTWYRNAVAAQNTRISAVASHGASAGIVVGDSKPTAIRSSTVAKPGMPSMSAGGRPHCK